MKNIQEILMANGIAMVLMLYLIINRRRYRESMHKADQIYDGMVIITLVGAFVEAISFLVDAKSMRFGIALNYISNSLCFLSTVSVAVLWCTYVDLRVYRNYKRTARNVRIFVIPWIIDVFLITANLFGSGILFTVSADNVYKRGDFVFIAYVILVVYYAFSIILVERAKNRGLKEQFFPIFYFIGPCLAGTVIQFFFYGLSASWVSAAIAFTFVQMQSHSEHLLLDSASGLFNRRYLNSVLKNVKYDEEVPFYSIMMDMNDFKEINDRFGHSKGDAAIHAMGEVLLNSIPEEGIAIRYAGDEFIVLLNGSSENQLQETMKEIDRNIRRFNESTSEFFQLSVSMGCAKLEQYDENGENFLNAMDERMYEQKRQYHMQAGKDRRKN